MGSVTTVASQRGMSTDTEELENRIASTMAEAWREPGFCVPNSSVYPHQWLWDSCFHAIVWAELDPARAGRELWSCLANQAESGFVPHMTYWGDPTAGADFWGRPGTSSITQPPMFGHTLAELIRRDALSADQRIDPSALADRVASGLMHLLQDRRRSPSGLVCVFHPWESGCDDSPRWPGANMAADVWRSEGQAAWRRRKSEMVSQLTFEGATPVASSGFEVGSVGFSALVAWNAAEVGRCLAGSHRGAEVLAAEASQLAAVVADRWSPGLVTWLDEPVVVSGVNDDQVERAASTRTSDALLALLVDPRIDAFSQLGGTDDFGGRFGPCGVHRSEPGFDPETYWRGPAWPQMSYLLMQAAGQAGQDQLADRLAQALTGGAMVSGLSEYWHPDSGRGLGAAPQTWAALGLPAITQRPGPTSR